MKQNYREKYKDFYNSKAWNDLRKFKFAEANGLCEKCLEKGIIRPGVDVHHKIPIEKKWDRRLDYDNLILLCKECHNEEHGRGGGLSEFLEKLEDL